jgi:hypothetical protein
MQRPLDEHSSTPRPPGLSDRDQRTLDTIARLAGPDGWESSARAKRLKAAGLSWPQWRRAVDALEKACLVDRRPGDYASGGSDSYRLTPAGSSRVGTGAARGADTPLDDGSKVSSLKAKQEPKPIKEACRPARVDTGGVTAPEIVHRVIVEIAPASLAALCEMRAAGLTVVAAPAPTGHSCCGRPMVPRKNGTTGVDFLGCATYPTCQRTLPIGTPVRTGDGELADKWSAEDNARFLATLESNS